MRSSKGPTRIVRVRFAPSPTGYLHVGGARTALFNFLYARANGGAFVLRVEDTDTARERPEFRAEIFNALERLGLIADESPTAGGEYGPYTQSERMHFYAEALAKLQATGAVYPCFCSNDAADSGDDDTSDGTANDEDPDTRLNVAGAGRSPKAVAYAKPRCACGTLDAGDVASRIDAMHTAPAYRLRVDQSIPYVVDDLIRGRVAFPPGEVEDFIVTKVGGLPLYNFAAAIDDAAMRITHVIRGEEHLANTPKQMLIAQALGVASPAFAHLPIILNTERKKLSKRDGATAVSDYFRAGFLPEALTNFLALLGWSPGDDREVLTTRELIELFTFDRVQKHGAVFNPVKLTWMNGEYMKHCSIDRLTELTIEALDRDPHCDALRRDPAHVSAVVELLRERAKTVAEIAGQRYFFSQDSEIPWDASAIEKRAGSDAARTLLARIGPKLDAAPNAFDRVSLEALIREFASDSGVKAGDVIAPLRVALTGAAVSPGIFEVCEVLGRELTVGRIAAFLRYVQTAVHS